MTFFRKTDRASEDRALARLLSAAASDRPHQPSPFLMTRLRAAIAAAAVVAEGKVTRRRPHPFGLAALQMLPALGLVAVVLAGFSGYETWQARRHQDVALARVASSGGGDLLLAVAFLGGDPRP